MSHITVKHRAALVRQTCYWFQFRIKCKVDRSVGKYKATCHSIRWFTRIYGAGYAYALDLARSWLGASTFGPQYLGENQVRFSNDRNRVSY